MALTMSILWCRRSRRHHKMDTVELWKSSRSDRSERTYRRRW